MKQFKLLSLLWLVLTGYVSAQPVQYKVIQPTAGGPQIIYKTTVGGSLSPDQVVGALPSDAVLVRKAGRSLLPYAPESTGVLSPEQFGMQNKYFSPNYRFCIDHAAYKPVNLRRGNGENTFTRWGVVQQNANANTIANVNIDWTSQLQTGEGRVYMTQNELHEYQENTKFYTTEFAKFVTDVYPKLPSLGYGTWEKYKYMSLNYETYYNCVPGQLNGTPVSGWGSDVGYFANWASEKNNLITLESTGGTKTLEQLAASGRGAWDYEMFTRRANRIAFILEAIRHKANPAIGAKVDLGTSLHPYQPNLNDYNNNSVLWDGWCKVSNLGGDSQGNITLTLPPNEQWTVKLDGDCYSHSDFISLYYYRGTFLMDAQDKQDIFNDHKAGTQNYPYVWSKIKPWHLVGEELALYEIEHAKMMQRYGKTYPLWRMIEPQYETGEYLCPFPENAGALVYNDPQYPGILRLLQPPWEQYSRVVISRFMAGDEANSGFYLFPLDFQLMIKDPKLMMDINGKKPWDFHHHSVTALHQARADMQPYEKFWAGTTLVTPEVSLNQTGAFESYTAGQAYNFNYGSKGVEKPAYKIRYKATATGWRVLVLGGMNLGFTQERTDILRVPGAMNGNKFRIKLRGPAAHVYEFVVKSSDADQTYEALPVAVPAWEKPGYSGRVGVATVTTPPSSTTTAPPSNTGTTGSAYNYPVPTSPQAWPTFNSNFLSGSQVGEVARIETNDIVVEIRKRYGAATQVYIKKDGQLYPQIDFHDHGREAENTYYGGPSNFSQGTHPDYAGIGWNPITVGDIGGNGSPVISQGWVTGNDGKQRWYTKTHTYSWPHSNGKLLECYNEKWVGATGAEVDTKTRTTFFRTDQSFYGGSLQEYPCFMAAGKKTMFYYIGNAPYTNAAVTQTNNIESSTGRGYDQNSFAISEPWVAYQDPPTGKYFALNTERMGQITSTVYYPNYSPDYGEGADQTSYCTSNNPLTIDPNGIWYHNYSFYVGSSVQAVRDWANAKPRKYGDVPDFSFDVQHGRNDWNVANGTDQREPFTDNAWHTTFVPKDGSARNSAVTSPPGIWKADLCPTFYIKMQYNGQENQGKVYFKTAGQIDYPIANNDKPNQNQARFPNGWFQTDQNLYFNFIKDSNYHTYAIPTSQNQYWAGKTIQSLLVSYGSGSTVIPNAEQWNIKYIGCVNPGN